MCLLALGACGSRQAPSDPGPACDDVAQHLVVLAARDNATAPDPELAKGIRAELARQCKETPWSRERRVCLAESRTQDSTLRCPR